MAGNNPWSGIKVFRSNDLKTRLKNSKIPIAEKNYFRGASDPLK